MNISSTPFIRNDYWPDYNDINQLNQRINEAENETALVNARLSNDIENVSANLNGYMSSQADTVITNNVIVNSLNANYAVGGYANFANTNTDNAYVENLTVNKPVFDITLNTPHIENATSLGGNFYNANLINPSFTDIGSMSLDSLTVNAANIKELFVNTQPEPVTSSAVLGYDSEGRVIPIHASYDVGFPEDANYLFTDHAGTAFAGVAATEAGASSNLITAHAVKNAIDGVTADVSDNFNIINDALNDVDSWMNNIENDVNNRFSNIDNSFNDVNNELNIVNDNFANIDNSFNDVNNTANNLLDNVDYLKTALAPLLAIPPANVSGWVNSDTPVNIQGITEFEVFPFGAAVTTGSDVGNGAKLNVTGTKATLALPGLSWTKESMVNAFFNCKSLNQNIIIPNGVTNMYYTFGICSSLNQNIFIPNSVTNMSKTFYACHNLNQNILIPNSVTDISGTFQSCNNFNQNILIPDGVTSMSGTFQSCSNFNQNILIPDGVTNMSGTFQICSNLNQNILIPNSVTSMSGTFFGCTGINQNIFIPNSVTDMYDTFHVCSNLNQNIPIPDGVTNIISTFSTCSNLNQNIYIYSLAITAMQETFYSCDLLADKYIHIRKEIPMSTSNYIYNCLVNNFTGVNWSGRVINDLEGPTVWPPEA